MDSEQIFSLVRIAGERALIEKAGSTYLERIAKHWNASIQLARAYGANDRQLQCMRDLSHSEFGACSRMRLRDDCFWSTIIDRDGDVTLWFISDDSKERVRVVIDHAAVIITTDYTTKHDNVFNAYELFKNSRTPLDKTALAWVLHAPALRQCCEPSLQIIEENGALAYCVDDHIFTPLFPHTDVWEIEHVDEVSGYVQFESDLHWFHLEFEDVVTSTRIYTVCALSPMCRLKAFWNCAAAKIEKSGLARIPRFSTKAFSQYPIGYCVL